MLDALVSQWRMSSQSWGNTWQISLGWLFFAITCSKTCCFRNNLIVSPNMLVICMIVNVLVFVCRLMIGETHKEETQAETSQNLLESDVASSHAFQVFVEHNSRLFISTNNLLWSSIFWLIDALFGCLFPE